MNTIEENLDSNGTFVSVTGSPLILTEEGLAAQAFVFIVAGSETTSATMSFCLYELSRNSEIQAKLHRELDALSDLSFENVNNCQYLDMVVSGKIIILPMIVLIMHTSLPIFLANDLKILVIN